MANSSPTAATEATKATTMPQPPVPDGQLLPEPEVDSATSFGQRAVHSAGGNSPQTLPGRYGALTGQMGHAPGQRGSALRQLQRGYGNQYVGRVIQAKLTVGQPGDVYEQEADRVADQIMRMPEDGAGAGVAVSEQIQPLQIQRMCTACEEEEEDRIHLKEAGGVAPAVTPAVESRLDTTRGGGQPLTESVRAQVEPRFRADFSRVRVHTGGEAAALNRHLKAQAFTRQRDIYFGAGKYNPESSSGKRLLAHELTHVVQQAGGNQKFIQRQETPQLPEQVIYGNTHLSRVVQDYRLQNQTLTAGRNLVAVKFYIGSGAAQIKVFENIPGGIAHAEEVMEQFFRNLEGQGSIEVSEVFSERQPCGPSRHDCEGMFLKNQRYRNAHITYAKQYQGVGGYRSERALAEIEASQKRVRATRNLEWDFPNPRQPPPYHERLQGPKQTRGGFFSRLENSFATLRKSAVQGFSKGGQTAKTFSKGFNTVGRGLKAFGKAVPKAFPVVLKSLAILGPAFEIYNAYSSYKSAEAQVNVLKKHLDAMWALYDELVKESDSLADSLYSPTVLSYRESEPEINRPFRYPFDRQPVTIYELSGRKLTKNKVGLSEIQLKTDYNYIEFYSLTDIDEFIGNISSIPVDCQQLRTAFFDGIQKVPIKFSNGYTKLSEYGSLKNIIKYQVRLIRLRCLMEDLARAQEIEDLAKTGDMVGAYLSYGSESISATCESSDINGWDCGVEGNIEDLKRWASDQDAEPIYNLSIEFIRVFEGQEVNYVYSLTSWIDEMDALDNLNAAPILQPEGEKLPEGVCDGNRYPENSVLSFILQHYAYGCYLH